MQITDKVAMNVDGNIGYVVIDNPPVSALGQAVREGIAGGIKAAEAHTEVEAVILIAEGRTFPAGADITEFGKPPMPPALPDVCQVIEDCSKPVIAAMHGTALGGGLEVALSAHYRIAVNTTKIGLPEINLGLLPGASGTQRMPRITGAGPALDLMLSGTPIGAAQAVQIGVVDEVCEGDLKEAATAYAQKLVKNGFGHSKIIIEVTPHAYLLRPLPGKDMSYLGHLNHSLSPLLKSPRWEIV